MVSAPIVEKRKLLTSGTSIMVAVPRQWLEEQRLKKGDEVLMVANGELRFMKANEENITNIRNRLNHNITRSDDQQKGRETSSP